MTVILHLHNFASQPFSRKEVYNPPQPRLQHSQPLISTISMAAPRVCMVPAPCFHQIFLTLEIILGWRQYYYSYSTEQETREEGNLARSFREKEDESEFPPRSAPTPETEFSLPLHASDKGAGSKKLEILKKCSGTEQQYKCHPMRL